MKTNFSIFLATLILPTVSIFSQTTQNDTTLQIEGPNVVVIAQKDRLLSGVPGSASYVKPLEMRRIAPISGNEVFKKIPGLNVVDEEGIGLRANIGIRGLDPDRSANVLVLEDGIPIQLNPYGEPEMYYTPAIDRISSIEIVKGSGQILFGPRTIGGVINYITAEPPASEEVWVSLKGGSGGYFSAQTQYGNSFGGGGFVANFLHKRADKIGVTGFQVTDFNSKVNFVLGEKSALGLKFQIYDETSNSTYLGLTQGMFDGGQFYPVMAPDDQLRVKRYALTATHKLFISNKLKLRTSVYGYNVERNWRRQSFSSDPAAKPQTGVVWGDANLPGGAVFMLDETNWRNRAFFVGGLESKLSWEYKIGKNTQALEAGARFHTETAHESEIKGARPDARSGSLVTDEFRPGSAVSGFVQNKFVVGSRLSFTAGLRFEKYDFERQILLVKLPSGAYRDTFIAADSRVQSVIPGLGFNFSLKNSWNVYGGVHKGFAPPLIKNSVSRTGEIFPLDAQESWNYELGLRAAPARGFDLEIGSFFMDFSKQVIPIAESAGGGGSGFANGGRTRHLGAEAGAKLDFGEIFESKYSVYWEASGTFSRAIFAADRFVGTEKTNVHGNFLPYAPQFFTAQTLGFALPKRFEIQLTGNYVSSQFSNELNTTAPKPDGRTGKIDAYFVLDASARYEFQKPKMAIFVSGKNLTDERYIASRRPTGIKVGIPRLLVGGVEVRF